ncbi:hypothetical protein PXH59_00315 (plasmid) [Xenorhabdus sp. SF857]|uniref:hypothetical protein n=1 Tax=Xenorhabdus bakwenae TaxID=3026967 RepID=UPI00255805A5|nr:hypothetical protein [Xenorhabdus sp. SF857]WFQ78126.1 hypothetical protein PXH59_00315 [Xenorhabdus sp. SF857]
MGTPSTTEAYQAQVAQINNNAAQLAQTIIMPQMSNGEIITDNAVRNESIRQSVEGSIFDAAGESGVMIAGTAANAIRHYHSIHGEMPSAELMSSMQNSIANMLDSNTTNEHLRAILDSAGDGSMSSSEGIIQRNRMVALVVPVQLMMITNDMVTQIPANYNKSEIFRINRVAGSTFGDLKEGDLIDVDFNGQYSSMDQRHLLGNGDGSKTEFTFDIATKAKAMPFVKGKVRILVDRIPVGGDDAKGGIFGKFLDSDNDTVTFTGIVNYQVGQLSLKFSKAPKNGIEIHTIADISIEKDPTLIPTVEHEMMSYELFPHESALASSNSIQSQFTGKREYNIDIASMQLATARNLLAAEKDRKRLNDMYFYAKGEKTFSLEIPGGLTFRDHYEAVQVTLLAISTELLNRTKRSGLVGLVAGREAARILKSIGVPHLVYAPNYRQLPQPHYVGTIFGYKFKEDPYMDDPWAIMCYAKGREHGDAGYVAGDAIPAINYAHPIGRGLKHESTLYELAYRDLHPHNGRDWFMWLRLVPKS